MSENFIFAYLGISVPLMINDVDIYYVLVGCVALVVSRFVSVVVIALFVNPFKAEKIPFSHQLVMTMGGLRGAVAFYLALNVSSEYKHLIITTTISIILFTIIGMGSATPFFLKWLDKTCPEDEIIKKDEEEEASLLNNDENRNDNDDYQPSDMEGRSEGGWSKAGRFMQTYLQPALRKSGWQGRWDQKMATTAQNQNHEEEKVDPQKYREEEKRLTEMRGDFSPHRTTNAVDNEVRNRVSNSAQRTANEDPRRLQDSNRGRVRQNYHMEENKSQPEARDRKVSEMEKPIFHEANIDNLHKEQSFGISKEFPKDKEDPTLERMVDEDQDKLNSGRS